jgi:hypothetical protein
MAHNVVGCTNLSPPLHSLFITKLVGANGKSQVGKEQQAECLLKPEVTLSSLAAAWQPHRCLDGHQRQARRGLCGCHQEPPPAAAAR